MGCKLKLITNSKLGQPLIKINHINKSINNDMQSGCYIATVELSQTINNFQQQQTGRLL